MLTWLWDARPTLGDAPWIPMEPTQPSVLALGSCRHQVVRKPVQKTIHPWLEHQYWGEQDQEEISQGLLAVQVLSSAGWQSSACWMSSKLVEGCCSTATSPRTCALLAITSKTTWGPPFFSATGGFGEHQIQSAYWETTAPICAWPHTTHRPKLY